MSHILKIELQGSKPKITRKIIVPEDFTFYELHLVIQCVMNWRNEHLFQFYLGDNTQVDSVTIIDPDEIANPFRKEFKKYDALNTNIAHFLNNEVKKMIYIYDFGDDWEHVITVLKKPAEEVIKPLCLDGSNAAPIEDCGGIWGFYELLACIQKPKKNADEKEFLNWSGIPVNASYDEVYGFNLNTVNQRLMYAFLG